MTAAAQRVGIFGGSFDPVHRVHVALAEAAVAQFALDEIRFIPAVKNPLKGHAPTLDAQSREKLLTAALERFPEASVDVRELERAGPSYTIETVREIATEHPGTELFLLLGADSFASLPQWKEAEAIATAVTFIVFPRPGTKVEPPAVPGVRFEVLDAAPEDLSSTDLRTRLEHGEDIRAELPPDACDLWAELPFFHLTNEKNPSCMIAHPPVSEALSQVETCCRVLDDKKAGDLRVLYVGEVTSVADYFIIASGTSAPHLRALREALAQALRAEGAGDLILDNDEKSGWVVLDTYSVMVHLFLPEQRSRYGLEALWKDAERVSVPERAIA